MSTEHELGEVIAYAIAAYRKSIPASDIFTALPTDANGYLARFIEDAIRHHLAGGSTAAIFKYDPKYADRYRFLRSGAGRDHKHHQQRCMDVFICDWAKNFGPAGSNSGEWSYMPVCGAEMDAAVDAQMSASERAK